MWSSIGNLKQNLQKIALDVYEGEEEPEGGAQSVSYDTAGHIHTYYLNAAHLPADSHPSAEKEPDLGSFHQYLTMHDGVLLKMDHDSHLDQRVENGSSIESMDGDVYADGIERIDQIKAQLNTSNFQHEQGHVLQFPPDTQPKHPLHVQAEHCALEDDNEIVEVSKLQSLHEDEHKLHESLNKKMRVKVADKCNASMQEIFLNNKSLEMAVERRILDLESDGKCDIEDDRLGSLIGSIATLTAENNDIKMEKSEIQAALEGACKEITALKVQANFESSKNEERELLSHKLEADLQEARHEREKALQELNRLKQHLIDKETEETEKMDEDRKIIEELRLLNQQQKVRILNLENSLIQASEHQEEVRIANENEVRNLREINNNLEKELASSETIIDSKNVELLNLQSALGQYFAEIEAKDHFERQLAMAREDLSKLSQNLKNTEFKVETLTKEKEYMIDNLSEIEATLAEEKNRTKRLEDDNARLYRALEHSLTQLTRISVDTDFLVDRRIVIKLLVTYLQRNHSKEVLDLMVRMLGFSEEDKQRISAAQQGKSIVRGVLGLPSRLVGGILSGGQYSNSSSEKQSFADLWVDFLLKEAEERERRELLVDSAYRSRGSTGIQNEGPAQADSNDSEASDVPLVSPDGVYSTIRL